MAGIVEPVHVWDATDYRANSRAQLALAQEFLDRIAIPADARVLDIGCGDGKVTALIRAASVTGCDRSPEMVALAAREHPECTFVVADVRELPFDAEFDVAVSFTALHWVVDGHAEALAAVCDALVPGGRFHAQFPGAGNMASYRGRRRGAAPGLPGATRSAGSAFPWLMPSLDVYRPMVRRRVSRSCASSWCRATSSTRATRVSQAGSGRRGCRTPTACRRTAVRRGSTRSSASTPSAMPPDAEGRLHVPSFRIELEARRP